MCPAAPQRITSDLLGGNGIAFSFAGTQDDSRIAAKKTGHPKLGGKEKAPMLSTDPRFFTASSRGRAKRMVRGADRQNSLFAKRAAYKMMTCLHPRR